MNHENVWILERSSRTGRGEKGLDRRAVARVAGARHPCERDVVVPGRDRNERLPHQLHGPRWRRGLRCLPSRRRLQRAGRPVPGGLGGGRHDGRGAGDLRTAHRRRDEPGDRHQLPDQRHGDRRGSERRRARAGRRVQPHEQRVPGRLDRRRWNASTHRQRVRGVRPEARRPHRGGARGEPTSGSATWDSMA